MRGFLAALALAACVDSSAEPQGRLDPLRRLPLILTELRDAQRGLSFSRSFGVGAPDCPPFGGGVEFKYLHDAEGAVGRCGTDGRFVAEPAEGNDEGNPAFAILCARTGAPENWTCEEGSYRATVAAAPPIWDVGEGGNDPDVLDSRVACVLAHELGHIALWHSLELEAAGKRLYDRWWERSGEALYGSVLRREFESRASGRDAIVPPDQVPVVQELALKEANEAFEAANAARLAGLTRASEDDADLYASALLARTRFDSGECANLMAHLEWQELTDPGGTAPELRTHDAPSARGWGFFWRSFTRKH